MEVVEAKIKMQEQFPVSNDGMCFKHRGYDIEHYFRMACEHNLTVGVKK